MTVWKKRSLELQALLNPAFCGEIIRRAIWAYQKTAKKGMPYPLVFLVLPILLHEPTVSKISASTRSGFHMWIENNQHILVGLANRVTEMTPYTKESILFTSKYSEIRVEKNSIRIENYEPGEVDESNKFTSKYFFRSETVGKWFAQSGNAATVFNLLGLKP